MLWVEGDAGSDACVCVWTAGTFGSSRYGRTNYGGKFVKFVFPIYIQGGYFYWSALKKYQITSVRISLGSGTWSFFGRTSQKTTLYIVYNLEFERDVLL